uniref:Caspase n=1 Tax=Anopheles farauti TaxID=69004 RepID=A0A182Q6W3_9DIPT
MELSASKTFRDDVDNNGQVLLQEANDAEIFISSNVHEVQLVDDAHYDMRHERRGVAAIFNHRHFLHAHERKGTDEDCANISQVLSDLQFDVRVYRDLTKKKLKEVLDKLSEEDHKNNDCLMVVIMTHGDDDVLQAYDATFPVDRLWENFVGKACPSLLGKPKLFFIQACRGSCTDTGVQVQQFIKQTDRVGSTSSARELPQPIILPGRSKSIQHAIPSMADLLVMYSTYKGHYSWRNPSSGSWFLQTLSYELRAHGTNKELLQLLTTVSRKVAYHFQSCVPSDNSMNNRKQMPCIVSMLTKLVYFPEK